jgi:glycerol uptake facilitator-like aquaporin
MYVCAQLLGAFVGLFVAHAMFDLPLVQLGTRPRTGWGQWLAEFVATFGLIALILTAARRREGTLGTLVGLYIGAAYWFTASTSFANPAVAIARAFTDTFSNIRLGDVPAFVLAEAMGCLVGFLAVRWLTAPSASKRRDGEPAPPVLAAEG